MNNGGLGKKKRCSPLKLAAPGGVTLKTVSYCRPVSRDDNSDSSGCFSVLEKNKLEVVDGLLMRQR